MGELIDDRVRMDLKAVESRTGLANREAAEATERANSMAAFALTGWRANAAVSQINAAMEAEIIERKRAEEELRRIQVQLRNLPSTLLQAQDIERQLLARELHDNIGQTLAALSMEAAALPNSSGETPDVISRRTRDLAKKIGGLAADVHRMSQQLHPSLLDDLGVEAALKEECTSFSQRLGITVRFEAKSVQRSLPGDIALCLFRVAQESLHNIAKHAGAKEVYVRLAGGTDDVALFIEDIGNGCSVEHARGKGGPGLVNMQERVRLINGSLQLRSQPGKGTQVEVHVPLSHNRL